MRISFKRIDEKYVNYLRKFDYRVPYVHDGKQRRPFVGCMITLSEYTYYVPLSSPKKKHKTMKNAMDFLKIQNGELGALNFNNMIPVSSKYLIDIDLVIHDTDDDDLRAYKELLNNQLSWCNKEANRTSIINKANNLYKAITSDICSDRLKDRCCDFKLLEQKSKEYNK